MELFNFWCTLQSRWHTLSRFCFSYCYHHLTESIPVYTLSVTATIYLVANKHLSNCRNDDGTRRWVTNPVKIMDFVTQCRIMGLVMGGFYNFSFGPDMYTFGRGPLANSDVIIQEVKKKKGKI